MYLSDFLKGGQTISAPARNEAISANSLVQLGGFGNNVGLIPVTCADNAAVSASGSAVVASTTVSSHPITNAGNNQCVSYVGADGSIFIATNSAASSVGLMVYKYSASGSLLSSATLSALTLTNLSISTLSNGNLVACYTTVATPYNVYFTIFDKNLNIVVAETLVGAFVGSNPGSNLYALPLTGGGFALAYNISTGVALAIYSNAGAQVYAPTLIAGTAAQNSGTGLGASTSMANLSNGNIVVVIEDSYALTDGFAIFTPAGAAVVALTSIGAPSVTAVAVCPAVSVLASGYFCVGISATSSSSFVAVFSNAGTLQGAGFSTPSGGVPFLVNDGVNFWGFFGSNILYLIPSSGAANCKSNTLTALTAGIHFIRYDPSGFIFASTNGTSIQVIDILNSTNPICSALITALASGSTWVVPSGDFTALVVGQSAAGVAGFMQLKYSNSAIVGVSQQTIASNNAGTKIALTHGGGVGKNGYPIGAIVGTVGKGFDHSAANIIGNKGTLYGSSVVLEGII